MCVCVCVCVCVYGSEFCQINKSQRTPNLFILNKEITLSRTTYRTS